jgi:hypothetical protein
MKKPFNFKPNVLVLAMMAAGITAANAEMLDPYYTPPAPADAISPDITQAQYAIPFGVAEVGANFTWNTSANIWTGPNANWTNTGIPTTLINTVTNQTVAFDTNADPSLTLTNVTTPALEPVFAGNESVAGSILGANATVTSASTINVTAPGTGNVSAIPSNVNYTFTNSSLAVNNSAAFINTTATSNGTATAKGSVTVSSGTELKMGQYTVSFDNNGAPVATDEGLVSGSLVALNSTGLAFSAITGDASVNTVDGNVTVNANVAQPTTLVSAAGITTPVITATTSITTPQLNAVNVSATNISTANLSVSGSTTTHGIDNSFHRITGVAPGELGTDAVNLNQLNSVESRLQKRIDDTDKNAKKGIATVAAMANIPQVDESKTFSLGAGVGGYDSEWGFAVGGSYRVAPAVILKGSIGTSDGGDVAGGLGISSSW